MLVEIITPPPASTKYKATNPGIWLIIGRKPSFTRRPVSLGSVAPSYRRTVTYISHLLLSVGLNLSAQECWTFVGECFPVVAAPTNLRAMLTSGTYSALCECRPDRSLERKLAGLSPLGKTLAEHAHRAEFHRSRKLIAAARAGALGLRFHGSDRPSEAIKASQRAWISPSAGSGAGWESGAWL